MVSSEEEKKVKELKNKRAGAKVFVSDCPFFVSE